MISWPKLNVQNQRTPSAVMLLLLGRSPTYLLLIRRSTRVRTHKGQVSLPGGRFESQDSSPFRTAVRETFEEVGLSPDKVEFLRDLNPVKGIDGSEIYPVLGRCLEETPALKANEAEVADIYITPLNCFLPKKKLEFSFKMFGQTRTSHLYHCGDFKVWGLTAKIISEAELMDSF
jgi:8-oxo-dGTP pyrophosphatase MutT (NUDIX family)